MGGGLRQARLDLEVMNSLPTTVGRYQLRQELGRGAMGVVYEAWDPLLERIVALKTIRAAPAGSAQEWTDFERRFLAEARAAAQLSHPGIVTVHDVGQDAETRTLYIALERLVGRTLADVVGDGVPLPWPEALRIAGRIAEALDFAHARGVVHRDIKPANVMLLASGEPKIMDFGIARTEANSLTLTMGGQSIGTPLYMSPEQALGQPVDGRSDIFSLGAVTYWLLTGRAAFAAESLAGVVRGVTEDEPTPPSAILTGLPLHVDTVISRALAKDPANRYRRGLGFAEDVADLLAGDPPRHGAGDDLEAQFAALVAAAPPAERPAPGEAPTPPATAARFPRRAVAGGVLVVALALAIGLGVRARGGAVARPVQPAEPAPSGPANPGLLAITCDGLEQRDTLRVWVDRRLVAEETLGRGAEKAHVRFLDGQPELSLAPGGHDIELRFARDGKQASQRLWGDFRPGATRRLRVRFGGLLRKKLSIDWE